MMCDSHATWCEPHISFFKVVFTKQSSATTINWPGSLKLHFITFFVSVVCARGGSDPGPSAPHAAPGGPHPPESPASALPAAEQVAEPPHSHRWDPHDSAQVHPPSVQPGEQPRGGLPRRPIPDAEWPSEGGAPSAATARAVGNSRQSGAPRGPAPGESRDGDGDPGGHRRGARLPRGVHPRPKKGSFLPDTTLIGGRVRRDGPKDQSLFFFKTQHWFWKARAPLLNDPVM